MTLFLIALVLACLFVAVLFWYSGEGYRSRHDIAGVLGVCLAFLCMLGIGAYGVFVLGWVGAKHQADIINREYGASYTQAEVFYASDVIETVRQLDRKRVELNGDLLRDGKPE